MSNNIKFVAALSFSKTMIHLCNMALVQEMTKGKKKASRETAKVLNAGYNPAFASPWKRVTDIISSCDAILNPSMSGLTDVKKIHTLIHSNATCVQLEIDKQYCDTFLINSAPYPALETDVVSQINAELIDIETPISPDAVVIDCYYWNKSCYGYYDDPIYCYAMVSTQQGAQLRLVL